jgi:hypothetical protein
METRGRGDKEKERRRKCCQLVQTASTSRERHADRERAF